MLFRFKRGLCCFGLGASTFQLRSLAQQQNSVKLRLILDFQFFNLCFHKVDYLLGLKPETFYLLQLVISVFAHPVYLRL